MAPLTTTETTILNERILDKVSSENKMKSITKKYNEKNSNNTTNKISSYYDETLPSTDPKFLGRLRQWEKNMGFVTAIRWTNAISISLFHIVVVAWTLHNIAYNLPPKWQTTLFVVCIGYLSGLGVTAGAHRYWTHRSFKANRPLQIIMLIGYSMAGQNNLLNWVRDHRLHHKMSETSADPHDVRRGFFFSHVGWLMMKKHPHVLKEGAKIDVTDIANEPLLKFYDRYFIFFKLVFCFILPIIICVVAWDEEWLQAIFCNAGLRYAISLNATWSVNSVAHIWGFKPYDRNIASVENVGIAIIAMGEGWHNYHHTFPWDYKAAELGNFFNVTTATLDLFAKIGWAYDLKMASPKLIESVIDKKNP